MYIVSSINLSFETVAAGSCWNFQVLQHRQPKRRSKIVTTPDKSITREANRDNLETLLR